MATVDVIIPAFNAATYLPAALESVGSQTFEDWQIVLVDDGSTDDTAAVVAPFLDRFGTKLKYIKQANRGLPAARNAAILASTSRYIALLDADDIWLPCRLADSIGILAARPNAGLAYALITYIDAAGKAMETFHGNSAPFEGRVASRIYMRKIELPCPTITIRRSCIDEVGLFDETMRSTEDRDLWLRIALRHEVAFVPKVLAYYRISPNSMSANSQRMLEAQLQFIRKHYGSEGCGIFPRQRAWARAYKQRAEAFERQHMRWAALKSALQAFMIYPLDFDNARTTASLYVNWIRNRSGR
jgi:glycosyltransferase involved in cell wall biosynthesis